MKKYRVVGIGACVMDTLIHVPNYPREDTKMRALSSGAAGGGPTATGIVAAAKLGADSAFIGVLSDDGGRLGGAAAKETGEGSDAVFGTGGLLRDRSRAP